MHDPLAPFPGPCHAKRTHATLQRHAGNPIPSHPRRKCISQAKPHLKPQTCNVTGGTVVVVVLEDVVVLLVELVDDVLVDEDDVELDVVLLDVVLVDEVSVCTRHWDSKHQRTSEFRQVQNSIVYSVSIMLHSTHHLKFNRAHTYIINLVG